MIRGYSFGVIVLLRSFLHLEYIAYAPDIRHAILNIFALFSKIHVIGFHPILDISYFWLRDDLSDNM